MTPRNEGHHSTETVGPHNLQPCFLTVKCLEPGIKKHTVEYAALPAHHMYQLLQKLGKMLNKDHHFVQIGLREGMTCCGLGKGTLFGKNGKS